MRHSFKTTDIDQLYRFNVVADLGPVGYEVEPAVCFYICQWTNANNHANNNNNAT